MKKIFSFIALLLLATIVVGCTVIDSKIEITKMPATTYELRFTGPVDFEFQVDEQTPYSVTWTKAVGYSVKQGDTAITPAMLEAAKITISPLDFESVGTKTVTIKYDAVRATFQYTVTSADLPMGTGTQNDPFMIYTAEDFLAKSTELQNVGSTVVKYFKLGADINFAGKSFAKDVNHIVIDGAKTLGGNYKILNVQGESLFANGKVVTLKNIDFVDAVVSETVIGRTFQNVHVDNVHILGNSFASNAGFFDTIRHDDDVTSKESTIKNSTTYANLIRFNASSSTGGFLRYLSSGTLKIDKSFNYGSIQVLNSYVGGLVGMYQGGGSKVEITNSGNYGDITVYTNSQDVVNLVTATNKPNGKYTLMGTWATADTWDTHVTANNIVINANNTVTDQSKVKAVLINENSFTGTLDLNAAGLLFIGNNKASDVVRYTVSVTVQSKASNHKLQDGQLTKAEGGGNFVVFMDSNDIATSKVITLPTISKVDGIVTNPYIISDSDVFLNGTNISRRDADADGYNISAGGFYRVVGTTVVSDYIISVIGFTSTGSVAFVSIGSEK